MKRFNVSRTHAMKGAVLLACSVAATSGYAEAPISDAYSPGESDSKWIVGGALLVWDNPYIHDDDDDHEYAGTLVPRIEYRGERFFSDTDGVGLTVFRTNGFSTGLILGSDESYLSDSDYYDDNDRLENIDERDATLNLGAYLLHNHGDGQFKLTVWQDISNEHEGQSLDASYTYNFPMGSWNVTPVVGLEWVSDDHADHFFSVSERESNASDGIAVYQANSSTNAFAGVSARYDITEHWDVQVGAGYVVYGSGIKDSPLTEDDDTFIGGFGVNYNF